MPIPDWGLCRGNHSLSLDPSGGSSEMRFRTSSRRFRLSRITTITLKLMALIAIGCRRNGEKPVTALPNPAAAGSICPNETRTSDGGILLSWLEPTNDSLALRFAIRHGEQWSSIQTIVVRKNFDKYPEAPPWVLSLAPGSLVAIWAEQLPPGKSKWPGDYLLSAVSSDGGANWSQPVIIHSDRTDGEHSFASIVPQDDTHAAIVWLDSRDYETRHTYRLMSAVISSSGAVSSETTVDNDVCTCCPTALIRTPNGLVAAYRNHTSDEIRDIYTAHEMFARWQNGQSLHQDNWHINGCPVNGPSLASNRNDVVAVWFTGKEDRASVQIGFSPDGGTTFQSFATLDSDEGDKRVLGRVSVVVLDSGDALVSWIRRQAGKSQLILAYVREDGSVLNSQVIAEGSSDSLGYPRMQNDGSQVLVAWGGTEQTGRIRTSRIASH